MSVSTRTRTNHKPDRPSGAKTRAMFELGSKRSDTGASARKNKLSTPGAKKSRQRTPPTSPPRVASTPRRGPRHEDTSPAQAATEPIRISRFLAHAGIASRRQSELIVRSGRIAVDGSVIDHPGVRILPGQIVTLDGQVIMANFRRALWRFHKPRGLLTTTNDPQGRPTIFNALPKALPRVVAVGRLDMESEGLLLLTNSGSLARELEHPDNHFIRMYRVRVHGRLSDRTLREMEKGPVINGVQYRPIKVDTGDEPSGTNRWLNVQLREGKNREIRRVFENYNLSVNRLIRVGFGPFQLGELPRGACEAVPARYIPTENGELKTDTESPPKTQSLTKEIVRSNEKKKSGPNKANYQKSPGSESDTPKSRSVGTKIRKDRSVRRAHERKIR